MTRALTLFVLLYTTTGHAGPGKECVRNQIADSYDEGWQLRRAGEEAIAFGRTAPMRATLLKGRTYRILTCSSEDITELDVLIYDKQGTLITRDEQDGNRPNVGYTPDRTGLHYVVFYVRDATSREEPGSVGWAVLHGD